MRGSLEALGIHAKEGVKEIKVKEDEETGRGGVFKKRKSVNYPGVPFPRGLTPKYLSHLPTLSVNVITCNYPRF